MNSNEMRIIDLIKNISKKEASDMMVVMDDFDLLIYLIG